MSSDEPDVQMPPEMRASAHRHLGLTHLADAERLMAQAKGGDSRINAESVTAMATLATAHFAAAQALYVTG